METAAQKAIKNSDLEITRDRMDDVFREAGQVNWHQVVKNFPSFNTSCLIEVLTKWLSQQEGKDPWIVWRKLAASVESLKEGSEDPKEVKHQLGIGYKLRLRFGVGLELNKDNLLKVLTTAGIEDLNILESGLELAPIWLNKFAGMFSRVNSKSLHILLEQWSEPQSWEELARVINDSEDLHARRGQQIGLEIAQMTRQLSGSGGFPKINVLYSDPHLKSKNVTSDTIVIFQCKARGAPPLKYNWMCDGNDLGLPDSWTVQLKITRGRLYNCRVENDFGSCISDPLQLRCGPITKAPPKIAGKVVLGEQVQLTCTVKGFGPFYYAWIHDNQTLVKEAGVCWTEAELSIEQMTAEDQGEYKCRFINPFGFSVSEPIPLHLVPQITEEPDSLENTAPGKPAEFAVKAVGKNLTYTWHHQTAKQLLPNEKRVVVGNTQILRIDKVEPSDEGYYVCTICNTGGTVATNPAQLTTIPQITEEPNSLENAVPGKPAKFVANAIGKNLTYTWHHQTAKQLLPNDKRVVVGNTRILRIDKVEPSDEGYYLCTICNTTGGTVETNPAQLTTIPLITEEPDSLENVAPGKPAEFVVKANGTNLTYTWHRQNAKQLLPNDKRVVVGDARILKIDKVEPSDEGYYVCTICNTTGGSVETNPAQLTTIPQITEEPDSLENVSQGKPAEFVVKTIGKNLIYTWHRQTAKQLLPNEKRVVVGNTRILHIDKVEPSDEGYYACTICNPTGGSVETNPAQLTAIPQITEEPDIVNNAVPGKPAEFVVKAVGKNLTYTWHRQTAKQLLPNEKRTVVGKTQILHIDKVEPNDEGYYICTICDPTGGSVETNPAQLTTIPQIAEEPDSLENLALGKPAEFVAKAIGKQLTYTWHRQTTKQLLPNDKRVVVGKTRILHIDKVESSDEGYYVCIICNPTGGSVETNPAHLTTSHQTISKTPCEKDTWEYKTLYANQAGLADQLADTHGIVNRLSYELYAREIISKAVLDTVDIHGPHVTEFMRVKPLPTAMLSKIRLNPKNYHEFRAAMLMRSVGVNRDVVDRFMPEKEELDSLKNAAPAGGSVETNTAQITTNISQTHEPNLSDVIDSLSSDDPTLVSNAACRLQHLALYGHDNMKSKIRQFGAIPVLVSHLQNSNTKVQISVLGALRNLSYGHTNDENKIDFAGEHGLQEILLALKISRDLEVRDLLTELLWNVSSCEELKLRIIQQCLQELVDNILVPCSGWSIEGASSPVVRPGLVQWKTELKNTTGIMRNVSSAGEPARVSVMRDSRGLVDSLVWMIKAAVQQKEGVDKKTVENSVCILRNLSYQLENEIDPQEGADDVLNHEWGKEQQRQMEELKQSSRKAPCCLAFLTCARAHNEPSHSVSRPLNDVNFADPDLAALPICQKPVRGKALLWQPEVVYPYLALIEHYSSCADILEAAIGAIQYLTTGSRKWAVYSRNIICTSNGLPVITNLLNSGHDTVIKAAATVLRNLTADAWNKAILGVNVIPLIITRLPFGSNHLGISEPTTIALLCTLMELCLYSPENAKLFQEKGGIPCLIKLTRSLWHTAKVTVAANKVCEILYEYKDCKSVLKCESWEIARYHSLEEENADQFDFEQYSSMSHNDVSSRQKVSKKGKKETKRVKRSTGKTLHYIKLEEIPPEDVEEQHSNEPEPDVLVDIERKQALKESQQQLEQKQQQHTATLESMESSV